jgi:uncharacterized protein YjbI with pentapeptide repeats
MPWRTEPEIGESRQQYLAERRATRPNINQGIYPFRDENGGIRLNRADVEWLLATHESGGMRGPVNWSDETQAGRTGIDLRGANLQRTSLRGLPLARTIAGIDDPQSLSAAAEEQELAAAHLEDANLDDVHLERAFLTGVHLERAHLHRARLEQAYLDEAHLEGCQLWKARLDGAMFPLAHFEAADLSHASATLVEGGRAHFEGANLGEVNMVGAILVRAHLEGVNLWHAHLDGADFSEAYLQSAQLNWAHLAGAEFRDAHLEGAKLTGASLAGTTMPPDLRGRLPGRNILRAANLALAFLDSGTDLNDISLGDRALGYVRVADTRWGGVNLAVVNWTQTQNGLLGLRKRIEAINLGDEREAHTARHEDGQAKDEARRQQEFTAAVRANRQLATALRQQGLNEDADRFGYRAQVLQREVLWRQHHWLRYLGALFLDTIAGHGYRPARSLLTYLAIVIGFAAGYFLLGSGAPLHLTPQEALFTSIISFHGRGFFPTSFNLANPITPLVAAEAICGLLIEITFIATFTNRFFAR